MIAIWSGLCRRFEGLSLRERTMVIAALAAAILLIPYALVIAPAKERQRTFAMQLQQHRAALTDLAQQRAAAAAPTDAGAARNRARSEELQRALAAVDERLQSVQKNLVPADRMTALLQEMLARDGTLELVALRTLPPTPFVAKSEREPPQRAAQGQDREARPAVYRHGVEITVRGTYSELHDYLTRLEHSRARMFWSRAQLDATRHPQITLTLTIHTLSLDRAWLQV